jgi:hypothetical protein
VSRRTSDQHVPDRPAPRERVGEDAGEQVDRPRARLPLVAAEDDVRELVQIRDTDSLPTGRSCASADRKFVRDRLADRTNCIVALDPVRAQR